MDRPSWAPVVLSGALPREVSDLVAIAIIELAALQTLLSQPQSLIGLNFSWIMILLVPLTSVLAAMSNSPNREREELALIAYGGSATQIELRYFLRGGIITTIGLLPLVLRILLDLTRVLPSLLGLAALIILGALTYAIPALRRTRSLSFVEQYKG
ncbi:MAG TPA: hypothetical protein VE955_06960 [Candidatus Dormibacteraeota bacterium]|nr:hypothetical protein [Candidatus Dormibacteraeota bacterium]